MIKIIKLGNVAICPICGCKFSYENEDIRCGDQREPYREVQCPCCEHYVDINNKLR